MTPAASQASMSQRGDPTVREISAETMKIPDPIMDPATSIVASVSVRALTKPPDDAWASPRLGHAAHVYIVSARGIYIRAARQPGTEARWNLL